MPRKGSKENISISLEADLSNAVDYFCEEDDINRSAFIRRAIKQYISQRCGHERRFWKQLYRRIHEATN